MSFSSLKNRLVGWLFLIVACYSTTDAQELNRLSVLDFGAKGDGKTNNTQAFSKAFEVIKSKSQGVLEIPDGDYLLSPIHVKANNISIVGKGRLISHASKGGVLLEIEGDGNVIDGLSFLEKDFARELLNINGSNNLAQNLSFDTPGKSKAAKVIYSDKLLHLSNLHGKNNIVDRCSFKNGRVGICLNGNAKLTNSKVSHNIIGVLIRSSSRGSEIANNTIEYNDVNGRSGNDGILAQRNVDKINIHNNSISYSGEHGIYFQGSNSIIANNKIFRNKKSGIKLGSYNDQLFNHTSGEYYIGKNNIIKGNEIYNNAIEDKVNAGIYMQAPLEDIVVDSNTCYGNYFGIRTTSVVSKRGDNNRTILRSITITNNKLENNRGLSLRIEGEEDILIENNVADGLLATTRGEDIKMRSFVLRKNSIKKITLNNLEGGKIEDNDLEEIDNRKTNKGISANDLKLRNRIGERKK